MAFDVARDGSIGNGRVFHDGRAHVAAAAGVPDGMDIDQGGNLFAAGPARCSCSRPTAHCSAG